MSEQPMCYCVEAKPQINVLPNQPVYCSRCGGQVTPATPEPSVRALLAQWRRLQALYEDEMRQYRVGLVERREQDDGPFYGDGRAITYKACIEQLEQALKPLADLAAEMQRFAETQRIGWATASHAEYPVYSAVGQQALAWAARLKALQEP